MFAASMAADALLATEMSNGGSQPNRFSDDMRLGRQDDRMVDPEREGERRVGLVGAASMVSDDSDTIKVSKRG